MKCKKCEHIILLDRQQALKRIKNKNNRKGMNENGIIKDFLNRNKKEALSDATISISK